MENILKQKGMLCNVKMDKRANCNRMKEDCNFLIYFPASSHLVYCL